MKPIPSVIRDAWTTSHGTGTEQLCPASLAFWFDADECAGVVLKPFLDGTGGIQTKSRSCPPQVSAFFRPLRWQGSMVFCIDFSRSWTMKQTQASVGIDTEMPKIASSQPRVFEEERNPTKCRGELHPVTGFCSNVLRDYSIRWRFLLFARVIAPATGAFLVTCTRNGRVHREDEAAARAYIGTDVGAAMAGRLHRREV